MSSLHERAGGLLLAALSRPAAERDAFLVAACKGDEDLLREVGSLLMFHDGEGAAPTSAIAELLDAQRVDHGPSNRHNRDGYSHSHNRNAYGHTRVCTDNRLAPPPQHSFGQVPAHSAVLWHDQEPQA